MIDNNNIILITDSDDIAKSVLAKLILLRENDNISVCSVHNAKSVIKNSTFGVALLVKTAEDSDDEILKIITSIKSVKNDIEILLLLPEYNSETVIKAYDCGIYDYLLFDASESYFMIKTVNCFKQNMLKTKLSYDEKFLNQLGAIDSKTGLYQYKYLKEIFVELTDNLKIKNGSFSVLTLDESGKTKISTNRLALAIKSTLRQDDIAAIARGGKFYLILPNIDLISTKAVLQKLQDKMGESFKIRAGVSLIGIQSFATLEKLALDGLTSAIQNDVIAVCLEHNIDVQNSWLDEDDNEQSNIKSFKLFKNVFNNKMNNVIIPLFFRYKNEFEAKLTNTEVSQYANDIECVFSLKNENLHSELTIRYNGFAKFKIEITHTGLDSAENTKLDVPLSKLTDKFLISLLKQLKKEYKQSAYKKGS